MSGSSGSNQWHADWDAQRERLSTYLDGELAPAEAGAFERHLASCRACQAELASLREVRALLGTLPQPALPRSFALPATTTPPAQVTPIAPHDRAAAHRPSARRTGSAAARAAQWLGGIAAVLGLALLLSSALAGHGPVTYSTSGARPAMSGGDASTTSHPVGPVGAGAAPTATPVPTSLGTPSQTKTPNNDTRSAPAEPPPLLPLAGGGLLLGGGLLIVGGTVAGRRRRQRGPPA